MRDFRRLFYFIVGVDSLLVSGCYFVFGFLLVLRCILGVDSLLVFGGYFGCGFLLIFGCYFECGFVVGFWMLFWVWIFVGFWMFFWVWIRCWFLDVILGVDFLLDHLFLGLCTGKHHRVLYIEAVCRGSPLCLFYYLLHWILHIITIAE